MPRKKQKLTEVALGAWWATVESSDDEEYDIPDSPKKGRLSFVEESDSDEDELSTAPSIPPGQVLLVADKQQGIECEGHEDGRQEADDRLMYKDGGGRDGDQEQENNVNEDEGGLLDVKDDENNPEDPSELPVDNEEELPKIDDGPYLVPENWNENNVIVHHVTDYSDSESSNDRACSLFGYIPTRGYPPQRTKPPPLMRLNPFQRISPKSNHMFERATIQPVKLHPFYELVALMTSMSFM